MGAFTEGEIAYMASQRLGRLATLGTSGEPHVVPVAFRFNPELETIDIGGQNMTASKKWRDVQRDGRVAFVIDDVLPPWQPRGIEVRGQAATVGAGGTAMVASFDAEIIRITPARIVSWGIDTDAYTRSSRRVR